MGHAVSTFIAEEPAIKSLSTALGNAPFHRSKTSSFCFLPVTDDVFDLATSLRGDSEPIADGYRRFSRALSSIASECSSAGPLAHVFTDYFGGDGTQGAAVWASGKEVMPPEVNRLGAINSALRRVGVKASPPHDEFDTIGLGQFRSNDDLLVREQPLPESVQARPKSWLRRLFNSIFE